MFKINNTQKDEARMIDALADVIVKNIKGSKYKIMNIEDVSRLLKEGMGDKYDVMVSMDVKNALREDDRLQYFTEDTYIDSNKYYFSTGNWLAVKGVYDNPIQAKHKMGMESWQQYKGEENND